MVIIGSAFAVKLLQASDAHGSVKLARYLINIKSKFNISHILLHFVVRAAERLQRWNRPYGFHLT